jgi:hypothetical protein
MLVLLDVSQQLLDIKDVEDKGTETNHEEGWITVTRKKGNKTVTDMTMEGTVQRTNYANAKEL